MNSAQYIRGSPKPTVEAARLAWANAYQAAMKVHGPTATPGQKEASADMATAIVKKQWPKLFQKPDTNQKTLNL